MGKEIVQQAESFKDLAEARKVQLTTPDEQGFSKDHFGDVANSIASLANTEVHEPYTLHDVDVYQTSQGALAVALAIEGPEESLHQFARRCGPLMYPGGFVSQVPVGHRWSIDRPESMPGL